MLSKRAPREERAVLVLVVTRRSCSSRSRVGGTGRGRSEWRGGLRLLLGSAQRVRPPARGDPPGVGVRPTARARGFPALPLLDRGAPVSIYTVARELGRGSDEMVKRIYAHLGDVRHRAEVVEYRVEQHLERLGDRLQRLGLAGSSFVTGNVTASADAAGTKNPSATEVEEGQVLPESGRPDSNRRRPAWEASDPSADQRPPA